MVLKSSRQLRPSHVTRLSYGQLPSTREMHSDRHTERYV